MFPHTRALFDCAMAHDQDALAVVDLLQDLLQARRANDPLTPAQAHVALAVLGEYLGNEGQWTAAWEAAEGEAFD